MFEYYNKFQNFFRYKSAEKKLTVIYWLTIAYIILNIIITFSNKFIYEPTFKNIVRFLLKPTKYFTYIFIALLILNYNISSDNDDKKIENII